jgi:endonuclease/exonuclease/phosphatase (EEP) superfamily protein YafD
MTRKTRTTSVLEDLIGTVVMLIGFVLAFLTTAGFLGGIWWAFDLAAHFRVQYAALLIPVVAVLTGLRRLRSAVLAGVALLVNIALVVPLFLATPAAPAGEDTLRVLTFNVTASNPDRSSVIDYLLTSDVDIIFLHESSTDWEDTLSRVEVPYRVVSARAPGSLFGTLALVGEDDVVRLVALGDLDQLSIEVVAEIGGREVRVLGTHPLSPTSGARSNARDGQLAAVGEWAAVQEVPVVVAGDLNASTWSRGFSLLTRPGDLVNSQRGFGVQASWPVRYRLAGIPIDHVVHSRDLTTVDRYLGESLGSDHYPLFVTLAVAGD